MKSFVYIADINLNIQKIYKIPFDNKSITQKHGQIVELNNTVICELEANGILEKIRDIEKSMGPSSGEEECFYDLESVKIIVDILKSNSNTYLTNQTKLVYNKILNLAEASIRTNKALVFLLF